MACTKCQGATAGFKCATCGTESTTHDEKHACGGAACQAKCSACGEAESKCVCSAAGGKKA